MTGSSASVSVCQTHTHTNRRIWTCGFFRGRWSHLRGLDKICDTRFWYQIMCRFLHTIGQGIASIRLSDVFMQMSVWLAAMARCTSTSARCTSHLGCALPSVEEPWRMFYGLDMLLPRWSPSRTCVSVRFVLRTAGHIRCQRLSWSFFIGFIVTSYTFRRVHTHSSLLVN